MSSANRGYLKNSLAALMALSATEPPPLFPLLPLLLLVLPLDPFFEVSPDFLRYFLPSLIILSMRPNHTPFLGPFCYYYLYPI